MKMKIVKVSTLTLVTLLQFACNSTDSKTDLRYLAEGGAYAADATATWGNGWSGGYSTGGAPSTESSHATGGSNAATGGSNTATGGSNAAAGGNIAGVGGSSASATGGATTASCEAAQTPPTTGMATGSMATMSASNSCQSGSCHGGSGTSTKLSLGGTIYSATSGGTAVSGATIIITEADGTVTRLVSNAAGNFFIPASQTLSYPINASVGKCPDVTKPMNSPIPSSSNGDCNSASCHSSTFRIHIP